MLDLFDNKGETVFYYCKRTHDKDVEETRYYWDPKKGLVHEDIKGGAVMDEVFALRYAKSLKAAFDQLYNSGE